MAKKKNKQLDHKEYKEKQLKETQVSVDFSDLVKTVKHLIEQEKDPRPNYRLREYKYCANCYYCTVDSSDKNHGDTFTCWIEDDLKEVLPNCVCDNYKGKK